MAVSFGIFLVNMSKVQPDFCFISGMLKQTRTFHLETIVEAHIMLPASYQLRGTHIELTPSGY